MQFLRRKSGMAFLGLGGSLLVFGAWVVQDSKPSTGSSNSATPADGHSIHVTAPHVVAGQVMGPYHHYRKVLSPELLVPALSPHPQLQCLGGFVDFVLVDPIPRPPAVTASFTRNPRFFISPGKTWCGRRESLKPWSSPSLACWKTQSFDRTAARNVVACGRYRQRDPGQGFEASFIGYSATSATVCCRQLPRNSIKSARPIRCSCCA